MQDTRGLKKFLSVSWIYEQFQNLVGAKNARKWIAENYWKLNKDAKVVDIGCGPGDVIDFLPEGITYVGFDISKDYIRVAKKNYGIENTFFVNTAEELLKKHDDRLNGADLVMCNGLLHHLSDEEATDVLQLSKNIMSSTGRLVCIEPTFLAHQGFIKKWIMSKDRGCNVRTEKKWKELVGGVFDSFETSILTDLIRIPYTHIVIECQKNTSKNT